MDIQTHTFFDTLLIFSRSILQFSLIVQDDIEFLVAFVQVYTPHEELRLYISRSQLTCHPVLASMILEPNLITVQNGCASKCQCL